MLSASKTAPKIADVFDTVADIGPVLPHAKERKIRNRAGSVLEAAANGRYADLSSGPFADPHVLKGLKTPSSYLAVTVIRPPTEPQPFDRMGFLSLILAPQTALPASSPNSQHCGETSKFLRPQRLTRCSPPAVLPTASIGPNW